jgi:coproporphyrinogen III oxidase-like Fe-S oxidoreductase
MYSLPQQTMEDLQQSLQDALSLQPDHLSLYSLTIEENTVFGKKGISASYRMMIWKQTCMNGSACPAILWLSSV